MGKISELEEELEQLEKKSVSLRRALYEESKKEVMNSKYVYINNSEVFYPIEDKGSDIKGISIRISTLFDEPYYTISIDKRSIGFDKVRDHISDSFFDIFDKAMIDKIYKQLDNYIGDF